MKKKTVMITGAIALAVVLLAIFTILALKRTTKPRTTQGTCVIPEKKALVTCDQTDAYEIHDEYIFFGLIRVGTVHKPCSLEPCRDSKDEECQVKEWRRYTPPGKCSLPSTYGPVNVSFKHPDAFVLYIGFDQHGNCLPKNMLRRVPCDIE